MEPVTVNVNRVGDRPSSPESGGWFDVTGDLETDLRRARKLARLLDAQFSFMGIPFGLDSIAGLIPVVGDTLTALASTYPIWVAKRHDLGKVVVSRMAFNVMVDWTAGLVPVVGDLIDVTYKANLKNLKLLEEAVEKKLRREGKAPL